MELGHIQGIYQELLRCGREEDLSGLGEITSEVGLYLEECEKEEKKQKNDLAELALNYWRLMNWVNQSNVDRKMAANSALKKIGAYLEKQQVSLMDLTGQRYDDGYAADVMGIESERDVSEEELNVIEMVKPIIMYKGSVIRYGQVILGDEQSRKKESTLQDERAQGASREDTKPKKHGLHSLGEEGISGMLRWCRDKRDSWLRNWRKSK